MCFKNALSGCFTIAIVGLGFFGLVSISPPTLAATAVSLERTLPETVYVEKRGSHQRLNFDFELRNHTDEAVEIQYLELRAFDHENKFITRAQIGRNGLPGPISALPERVIQPGETLYLFNPFPDLPTENPTRRVDLGVFHSAGSTSFSIALHEPPGPYLARVPLMERAYVFSGNDLNAHHRRVSLNSEAARAIDLGRVTQRFALDFTIVDPESGDLTSGEVTGPESWLAYEAIVIAPVNGTVITVRNNMPDNRIDGQGRVTKPENYSDFGDNASLGNYIILKVENAYLVMSHFRPGSLTLKQGETVEAGERIGVIGFSGDTAYPHLHMQLQSTPDILRAAPLPILFECFVAGTANNAREVISQSADTGMVVHNCGAKN